MPGLDLKQLRALLAIAESGSVTRAAEMLHIVQPAVSRQLRLLEEDLGTPLFERGSRGMALTEAGHILVDYARRALHELDRARAEIQPSAQSISGLVAVGVVPSAADPLAGELVGSVQRTHPDIRLRISMGLTSHLQQWLERGEIDVAIMYDTKPSSALDVEPLLEDDLWLVGPPSLHLSAACPVPLRELERRPMVLPSPAHALRGLVEHALAVRGVSISITAETNSMQIQKDLVARGFGLTVLPSGAVAKDIARGELSGAPICDPTLQRRLVLATSMTRRTSSAVRVVASELIARLKENAGSGEWPGVRWLHESHATA